MHYDLNKIKVKNVISYNNDIHFEGECEYDNGECISYAKNKGNKYNNGNSDNNGKYSNKQKHDNNDSNKQKHDNNDSNKQKHGNNDNNKQKHNNNNDSNKQKYGNMENSNNNSNSNKLIKVINNYEIECLYKINVNNYYKNINIYNYKNKLII